jgi:hypothetical protein
MLITTGNRQNPRLQNIVELVDHSIRIARIGNAGSKLPADTQLAFGHSQQQKRPPSEVKRPPSKAPVIFLRATVRKRNERRANFVSGGCGLWHFLARCRLV